MVRDCLFHELRGSFIASGKIHIRYDMPGVLQLASLKGRVLSPASRCRPCLRDVTMVIWRCVLLTGSEA